MYKAQNNKREYPTKRKTYYPKESSKEKPLININKQRYHKGHQNQLVGASRRTETYTKDKTVIVTESVDILDFNNDMFEYKFAMKNGNKRRKY